MKVNVYVKCKIELYMCFVYDLLTMFECLGLREAYGDGEGLIYRAGHMPELGRDTIHVLHSKSLQNRT